MLNRKNTRDGKAVKNLMFLLLAGSLLCPIETKARPCPLYEKTTESSVGQRTSLTSISAAPSDRSGQGEKKKKEKKKKKKAKEKGVVMPIFPGGRDALSRYLAEQVKYPTDAALHKRDGTVRIRFIIGKDGSITHATVFQSVHYELDREALRVVQSMPKWIPGKKDGVPVAVQYTLPITFSPIPD